MFDILEEAFLEIGIAAELRTKDAKGAGRVTECLGDLLGRLVFNEVGAQRFVPVAKRFFRSEEEASLFCYFISITDHGIYMLTAR
ncbi:TPA: hypothetical protein DD712_01120 [Candidatus Acetothermia bacterium]|nr:hypothetical protein [Candidatus Acetothermia bacterium]